MEALSVFYFLSEYSACCRYSEPFYSDLKSRINNTYNLRHLASFLVYGTEGLVRRQEGDRDFRNQSSLRGASGRDRERGDTLGGLKQNNSRSLLPYMPQEGYGFREHFESRSFSLCVFFQKKIKFDVGK
jgi:hypothetical protein